MHSLYLQYAEANQTMYLDVNLRPNCLAADAYDLNENLKNNKRK